MSLLEALVATPLAGAVGWTLLHSLWEGALVCAALAAFLFAVRSPRARYAAACLALLLVVGGFGVTLVHETPQGSHGPRMATDPMLPAWKTPVEPNATNAETSGLAKLAPWLAPFWMAGVFAFYLGHAAAWISATRLRRRGVCCAPEEWQKRLARFSARLRIQRPVHLLESCLVETPMVLGHFRPVILMPLGLLAGLPMAQVEAILWHEMAHIRRYDYLVNVGLRFVEGLLFYHPAVWWISRTIREERENCCDDVAVELTGNAHEYAIALAVLEQNRWSRPEPAVAATGGNLMKRIRRLLNPKRSNAAGTPLAAVILMFAAAVALTAWQSAAGQQSPAATEPGTREMSPYGKWLNEDVVYIIGDNERAAFRRLTTNEDRDKFIEQFWELRNPTPGAAENAFKVEHYRRIVYANEHFASSLPGWRTDRGHMYILYGPPDEIESHPAGGGEGGPKPNEVWLYRHIDGMGDRVLFGFADELGNGEYKQIKGAIGVVGNTSNKNPIRVGAGVAEQNLINRADPV
jgi:GWxTD domain-containing protein